MSIRPESKPQPVLSATQPLEYGLPAPRKHSDWHVKLLVSMTTANVLGIIVMLILHWKLGDEWRKSAIAGFAAGYLIVFFGWMRLSTASFGRAWWRR